MDMVKWDKGKQMADQSDKSIFFYLREIYKKYALMLQTCEWPGSRAAWQWHYACVLWLRRSNEGHCEVVKSLEGQLSGSAQEKVSKRERSRQRWREMSVPHVSSRGTMRESRPPPHWEKIQKGNLRLRQPRSLLVNMFFFFFFLSPPQIWSFHSNFLYPSITWHN